MHLGQCSVMDNTECFISVLDVEERMVKSHVWGRVCDFFERYEHAL